MRQVLYKYTTYTCIEKSEACADRLFSSAGPSIRCL